MDSMTLFEVMGETIKTAKRSGRRCYLYKGDTGFWLSFQYRKDWLFQVYPGGRKILSAGKYRWKVHNGAWVEGTPEEAEHIIKNDQAITCAYCGASRQLDALDNAVIIRDLTYKHAGCAPPEALP